jgi:hypothetical protein
MPWPCVSRSPCANQESRSLPTSVPDRPGKALGGHCRGLCLCIDHGSREAFPARSHPPPSPSSAAAGLLGPTQLACRRLRFGRRKETIVRLRNVSPCRVGPPWAVSVKTSKKSTLPSSTFVKIRFLSLNSKTGQNTFLNF